MIAQEKIKTYTLNTLGVSYPYYPNLRHITSIPSFGLVYDNHIDLCNFKDGSIIKKIIARLPYDKKNQYIQFENGMLFALSTNYDNNTKIATNEFYDLLKDTSFKFTIDTSNSVNQAYVACDDMIVFINSSRIDDKYLTKAYDCKSGAILWESESIFFEIYDSYGTILLKNSYNADLKCSVTSIIDPDNNNIIARFDGKYSIWEITPDHLVLNSARSGSNSIGRKWLIYDRHTNKTVVSIDKPMVNIFALKNTYQILSFDYVDQSEANEQWVNEGYNIDMKAFNYNGELSSNSEFIIHGKFSNIGIGCSVNITATDKHIAYVSSFNTFTIIDLTGVINYKHTFSNNIGFMMRTDSVVSLGGIDKDNNCRFLNFYTLSDPNKYWSIEYPK